jgi:hypothetical protein
MGGEGAGRRVPGWRGSGASGVEVVGQGLVEVEVWDGVGPGRVEGRRLIEEPCEEIALGWSAAGERGGGLWGSSRWRRMAATTGGSVRTERSELAEGKREDPHLGAAGGTQQRQHVVGAREQDGPADGSPVTPSGRSSIVSRVDLGVRFAGRTLRPLGSGRGGALTRRLGGNGRGGGIPFGRRRLGPAEGHHVGPEPGIRSQHTVVAMAMDSRGRDEGTDAKRRSVRASRSSIGVSSSSVRPWMSGFGKRYMRRLSGEARVVLGSRRPVRPVVPWRCRNSRTAPRECLSRVRRRPDT